MYFNRKTRTRFRCSLDYKAHLLSQILSILICILIGRLKRNLYPHFTDEKIGPQNTFIAHLSRSRLCYFSSCTGLLLVRHTDCSRWTWNVQCPGPSLVFAGLHPLASLETLESSGSVLGSFLYPHSFLEKSHPNVWL